MKRCLLLSALIGLLPLVAGAQEMVHLKTEDAKLSMTVNVWENSDLMPSHGAARKVGRKTRLRV